MAGEYFLARHAHNISGAHGWGVLPGLVEHKRDIVAFCMQGWGVLPGPAMRQCKTWLGNMPGPTAS